jgi:ATP-dependent Lhr-like helicase
MLPQTFHPIIRDWFKETYDKPTPVQAESWPLIERKEHVLALAPTGSGKTLTAFLSAISRFCCQGQQKYRAEELSVLYISPLKALNEDIKRNLLIPLAAIKNRFEKEGLVFPSVNVETRSGDTPQSQRRRFFIKPPSILALTPESLAILLLNPKGRQVLSNVKYVIIDEIHALIGNKRGVYLSCQIDRLSFIAGEFQRISLSATVRNPQVTAEFVGGIGRKVKVVSPAAEKKIEFSIEYPELEDDSSRYTPIINYILKRIWEGAALLVFTDSRRRAERLCYFINQESAVFFARNGNPAGHDLRGTAAFPHHGSLSKELRRSVEKGLAEGSIRCVVATASLELGIDIGEIDEVVLAGSAGNVSQALQRIGRSGHSVGQVSKGKLFAFHGSDLLVAAALKNAVDERDIEEIHPMENPQDILAQLILALCSEKDRNINELYEHIRNFYLFRNLNYDSFNRVIHMLAGYNAKDAEKTRLRDIKPRIWLDKTEEKVGVLEGTTTLLYTSGGVIANRGHYSLRLADGTKIGELDEEFVWERRLGDGFDFGARGWRITNINAESVEVVPLENRANLIPFWKGDTPFRSKNLTERLLTILDEYNKSADIKTNLAKETRNSLIKHLNLQKISQDGNPLPDKNNISVEIIKGNELNRDFCTIVFHSFRGGQINYPLSLALSAEMEEIIKLRVESFPQDDNILFLMPRLGLDEILLTPEEILKKALTALEIPDGGITRGERLFRNRLESSALFGASFREAAERSLLLPKAPFGKRTPLWIMRQRAKRLFDAVAEEDGFPATAEAWRCCLVDTFDIEGFCDLVTALNNRSITLSFFYTNNPSPFSRNLIWEETNAFMYEYDERKDLKNKTYTASLSDKIIEEAIYNASLRPVLKKATVDSFTSRLRREINGYAPEDALSLNEWIKERIAIPLDEWKTLLTFIPQDLTENIDTGKIKTVMRNGAAISSVVHREWEEEWKKEPLNFLGQWLRYEGPVCTERICEIFGVTVSQAEDAVNALSEIDEIVCDVLIKDEVTEKIISSLVCDRENMEMLLRLSRKKERPVIKERASSVLIPFLALRQGLTGQTTDSALNKSLYAWTAPAKLWETEILFARNTAYNGEKLNREIHEGKLVWYGAGRGKTGFCRPEDIELAFEQKKPEAVAGIARLAVSAFFNHPRDFWEIKNELAAISTDSITSSFCYRALWNEVWQSVLSADSFEPVRKGIEQGFIPKEIEIPQADNSRMFGRQSRIPSALKNRWKSGAPVPGNWFSLLINEENDSSNLNILEEDALNRDRVRLLLDRWGVLCRPLLKHESPAFSWAKLLPAMRRMELAGEIVTGRFFAGINSLQFASLSIAAELEKAETYSGIYWMNAADPASPAGLEIEGLDYKICARIPSNRIYFRGASLIAVSQKNGKELQILIEPDDPDIIQLVSLFKIPRTRTIMPEKKILTEKINGQNAADSIFASFFLEQAFISDRGKLVFW